MSSLIGVFSDTSLFLFFHGTLLYRCGGAMPFSWFLVGTGFSLDFTLPLAP
jgi:hypothetical protein